MSEGTQVAAPPLTAKNSVLVRMAERFGVDAAKLHGTLKATAFKGEVSNEQFLALMIVADQYKLNPLTKEIYAFPDKNNGIVPVVGVDGWSRIINEHPQFNGLEFIDGPPNKDGVPEWIECIIYRKDRDHATKVREYLAECRRATGPWGSHPRRMLRHKALIQCARMAMGFVGIYDQDEAERIVEGETVSLSRVSPDLEAINAEIIDGEAKTVVSTPAEPKPPAQNGPGATIGTPQATHVPAETAETPPTYAYVMECLQKSPDADTLDLAADSIRRIVDEGQRAELDIEYRRLKKKFAK
jgi:phage recombination protein Bet